MITADVHWCEPTLGHQMHQVIGMREPGWYVLVRRFDRLYTHGPYATREDAEAMAGALIEDLP